MEFRYTGLLLKKIIDKPTRLTLGLMSGTSADGVDISACEVTITKRKLRNLAATTYSYPADLHDAILRLASASSVELNEMMLLSIQLGYFYAQMIDRFLQENRIAAGDVDLIGSHGQTVAHLGEPQRVHDLTTYATLQLGDADIIAKQTGVLIVSDFRSGDIAVGGAGAPLAPLYHAVRFAEKDHCRAVVNIGGIANVTLLKSESEISGSDSGPGNCLLDEYISRRTAIPFDRDGETALRGAVQQGVLDHLKAHPLFERNLPRSYDRGEVVRILEDDRYRRMVEDLSLEDAMATLSMFTAETIKETVNKLSEVCRPDSLLVCGGGALNKCLMKNLAEIFAPASVTSTAKFGSNPEFVEAEAFAYLANLTLDSQAGNLPTVTGANSPAVLGKISQP